METYDYNQFLADLGQQLKAIRKLHSSLTQEQVAEHLGRERVSVGYNEQGRRAPQVKTLFDLAQLYKIDIRDFFAFLDTSDRKLF